MILEVRETKGLQANFPEVRILKGLGPFLLGRRSARREQGEFEIERTQPTLTKVGMFVKWLL